MNYTKVKEYANKMQSLISDEDYVKNLDLIYAAKNEYEELVRKANRVEELEKKILFLKDWARFKSLDELIDRIEKLTLAEELNNSIVNRLDKSNKELCKEIEYDKKYVEIGKALELAIKKFEEIQECDGIMLYTGIEAKAIYLDREKYEIPSYLDNIEQLLKWYRNELETEE